MLLVAPGRLSAITGCFICSESFWAIARPAMSVGPPGGNGRIRRMALLGYACPSAACGRTPQAIRASVQAMERRAVISLLLVVSNVTRGRPPTKRGPFYNGPTGGRPSLRHDSEEDAMFKRTLATLAVCLMGLCAPALAQVKEIPWGTSAVGSAGHKALVVLADLLNK